MGTNEQINISLSNMGNAIFAIAQIADVMLRKMPDEVLNSSIPSKFENSKRYTWKEYLEIIKSSCGKMAKSKSDLQKSIERKDACFKLLLDSYQNLNKFVSDQYYELDEE